MTAFMFDITGPKKDRWVWKRVDESGKTIEACQGTFPFYLNCVEDAKRHGFAGRPLFPPRDAAPDAPPHGP